MVKVTSLHTIQSAKRKIMLLMNNGSSWVFEYKAAYNRETDYSSESRQN